MLALSLFFVFGVWSLVNAVVAKRFTWRGGGPMPRWLGRLMSILFGLYVIWFVFSFWNR
jgi:hypothetical protein